MKQNLEFKNLEPNNTIRKLVARLTNKLERKAKRFPPDQVYLRLMVEENAARTLYRTSLTMEIPGEVPASKKTLAAKAERHDLNEALRDVFAEIDRQVEAYKSTLRGEQWWKRKARREELRALKMSQSPAAQQTREAFFSHLQRHLKGLYKFVRHQITYLESTGDLAPGELSADDVVDAVLIRAFHEFVKAPAEREFGNWLQELTSKQLESEVRRLKSERERTVHIEEDIPETPPAEAVSTLGDEILDFYQPDEDLKLEDIFPEADVSTPEEWAAAKEELLRCVNAALESMPSEWRRALKLRHVERLTSEDLAEALDKAEPEIEEILEYARRHLRQKLTESGCTFIVKGSERQPDKAHAGT